MRALAAGLILLLATSVAGQSTPESASQTILDGLSLEEKVGQLFLVYHSPADFMANHGFGGSLVMQSMVRNVDQLEASLVETQTLSKIPLFVCMDQEGGKVNRLAPLPGFSNLPSATEMGLWSPDSVRSVMVPVASRLSQMGINLNLAPVLDPSFDVDFQATFMNIRQRSFGQNSRDIVPHARGFINACKSQNVLCIVKHFPGYVVAENSDHEVAESVADQAAVRHYMHPFASCMDEAGGVMMSSIRFSMISEKPAVFDSNLVALSRCGFEDRVVMTDDLWGTALRSWVSGGEVDRVEYSDDDLRRLTLLAFDAGCDVLMITFPAKAVLMKQMLVESIAEDDERMESLNESVLRILLLKVRLGLLRES